MKAFRFPLEKVLDWRRSQLEIEQARFRREIAALAELERLTAECDLAAVNAEAGIRAAPAITGSDLAALAGFRTWTRARQSELAALRAGQLENIEKQRQAMLEAQRRCRLLERLRERERLQWRDAEQHALEELATESFLSGLSRRRTDEKPVAH